MHTYKKKLPILAAVLLFAVVAMVVVLLIHITPISAVKNYNLATMVDVPSDAALYRIAFNYQSLTTMSHVEGNGKGNHLYHDIQIPWQSNNATNWATANNQYLIVSDDSAWTVPYGYQYKSNIKQNGNTYLVYESTTTTNLGMFYSDVVSTQTWKNAINQPALYHGIPLTYAIIDKPIDTTPSVHTLELACTTDVSSNHLSAAFQAHSGYEIYVHVSDMPPIKTELEICNDTQTLRVPLSHDGGAATIYLGHQLTGNVRMSMVGNFKDKQNITCKISALSTDTYQAAYSQPVWKNVNVAQERNTRATVRGEITVESDGYFQFAVPYHSYWSAYIDGKEVSIQKTAQNYMLIDVASGTHVIEFKYVSPMIRIAVPMFMTAFCAWIIIIWLTLRNNTPAKRNARETTPKRNGKKTQRTKTKKE